MTSFSGSPADVFDVDGLKRKQSSSRSLFNTIMTGVSGLCIVITLIPLVLVLTYVIIRGFNRFDLALFTQLPPAPGLEGGGIANAIQGTLIVCAIATLVALPFGVMTAIWLSEFSEGSKLAESVRFATNVLSGVPSIIAGVFIYGLLVRPGVTGYSAIAGGVALAVLMLPTIIRTTDEALKIVPQENSLGLDGGRSISLSDGFASGAARCGAGNSDRGYSGHCSGGRGNRSADFHGVVFRLSGSMASSSPLPRFRCWSTTLQFCHSHPSRNWPGLRPSSWYCWC
jgi:hypothetical protein